MSLQKPVIVPNVQSLYMQEGHYCLPKKVKINFGGVRKRFNFFLKDWLEWEETNQNADIILKYNSDIKPQGYKIIINDSIVVEYAEDCGAFYAFTTLKQIILGEDNNIPKLTIEDWPDIEQRGLMLDVSRGRMTRIDVIKDIIDWLVSLKYNQFQLYFDAIIFDYSGLEQYTAGKVVYTQDEIAELIDYCSERFMQLVPNQNSFGHMEHWIRIPALSHLAITRNDGTKSGTLNPLEDSSLEFMDQIYNSLLPFFQSNLVNIGCDETELGQGETREACEKYGCEKVYLDYLLKLHTLITQKYNRVPMFWDDIAMHHPELIPMLPKDLIVIEWGYEFDHPFEEHCKRLHDLGLRFYVAPGTSTWNSLCGRTANMLENIKESAKWAKKYGAEGYLLTDWGDGGQPQPLACSLIAYVLGGMYAWHVENCETKEGSNEVYKQAAYFSNKYIFNCDFNMFDWLFRLGKYSHLEGMRHWNTTILWKNLQECHPMRFPVIKEYINSMKRELDTVHLNCKYEELILRELCNACRLLQMLADPKNGNEEVETWKQEYQELWDMRSKHDPVGYGMVIEIVEKYFSKVTEVTTAGAEIPYGATDIK